MRVTGEREVCLFLVGGKGGGGLVWSVYDEMRREASSVSLLSLGKTVQGRNAVRSPSSGVLVVVLCFWLKK